MNEKWIQNDVQELQQILKFFVCDKLACSKYLIDAICPGIGRRARQVFSLERKERFIVSTEKKI